jgi:hypothetical protein
MTDARPLRGVEDTASLDLEELSRLVGIGRERVRDVDRRLCPGERLLESLARGQVDAARACDHGGLVSRPLDRRDHMAPDPTGAPDYRDSHPSMVLRAGGGEALAATD